MSSRLIVYGLKFRIDVIFIVVDSEITALENILRS